jgi:hypothetical protein
MNCYTLFYEKVGVAPKSLFLADTHYPNPRIFTETIKKAIKDFGGRPIYYVDIYYKNLFFKPYLHPFWNVVHRLRLFKRHRYIPPLKVKYPNVVFFRHLVGYYGRFRWAKSLREPLYWLHGSLLTAINLAAIIYPSCDIKLVGVDLNEAEAFYDEEIQMHPEWISHQYPIAKKIGTHLTAIAFTWDGKTFFDGILWARDELHKYNRRLLCCSPNSRLVLKGICDYSPVIDKMGY